ncbi:unnamed protein product [Rhizopus stolonifer]
MHSVSECEQILNDTLSKEQYKVSISCGRLLYTIAHIALSRQNHDQDVMDTDVPITFQMEPMITRVIESISRVEKVLEKHIEDTKQDQLVRIQEFLKIKAQCCALLSNWDFDFSFKEAYNLLSTGDDKVAVVLLPYLSFLLQKCRQLPQWFPENAIEELKKRMNRSSVFVNLMKLLLRTTPSTNQLTSSVISLLHDYGSWDDTHETFTARCWNLYLISLEAGCCGWYELMYTITKGLNSKVESETCSYWLKALSSMALAEKNLADKVNAPKEDMLLSVINPFASAITKMKALQALGQQAPMQLYFAEMRMEMILVMKQTLDILSTPLDDSIRLSRQFKLMQECANRFRKLASQLDPNDQSSHNFNKETKHILGTYNVCLLACEYAARSIGSSNKQFCIDPTLIPILLENKPNENTLFRESHLANLYKNLVKLVTNWSEMNHLEDVDLYTTCAKDMRMLLQDILAIPLILPKSFFKVRGEMSV